MGTQQQEEQQSTWKNGRYQRWEARCWDIAEAKKHRYGAQAESLDKRPLVFSIQPAGKGKH
jgi:hypothetical protein